MICARAIAIAVGLLAGLPACAAAAVDEPCDAEGSPEAEQVVMTPMAQGYQVTEVYGEGVYRASRCDRSGDLVRGQTVAPILEPDGDVALVPSTYSSPAGDGSVLYGDPRDPVWSRAWATAGDRIMDSVIDPPRGVDVDAPQTLPAPTSGGQTGAAGLASAAQANDACTNRGFVRYGPLGFWPARRYGYRINGASFGNNARTRSSLVAAHSTWDRTRNDCGVPDRNNLITDYLGLTRASAKSRADGLSVIDKGEVANISRCGNSRAAIACSFLQPGQVAGPFRESDQRYDDDFAFTNDGAVGGAYDYWHIAAHESGHSIGLDHSTASRWATMYPQALQASTYWRTLAVGDIVGMRNIYP